MRVQTTLLSEDPATVLACKLNSQMEVGLVVSQVVLRLELLTADVAYAELVQMLEIMMSIELVIRRELLRAEVTLESACLTVEAPGRLPLPRFS